MRRSRSLAGEPWTRRKPACLSGSQNCNASRLGAFKGERSEHGKMEVAVSNEDVRSTMETVHDAAQAVTNGVSAAASGAAAAARQASDGVTEFRAVIRRQPITLAFLMLAMGYVLGRVSGRDAGRPR